MARIDSILSIMVKQGGNELRVGTDREPRILASGTPIRLSLPATPESTLRDLLGDILSAEREEAMRAKNRIEVVYEGGALGAFRVALTARETRGFDAVFFLGAARSSKGRAAEPATPAPTPSPAVGIASNVATPGAPASTTLSEPASALSSLVARAAELKASDLHLADGEVPTVRVDGILRRLDGEGVVVVAQTIGLDAASADRVSRGESLDLGLDVAGAGRIRMHVYRAEEGLAAAVRLLSRVAPSLASLHMPLSLDDVVDLPHGLVLVCGATGSGKSTTLAALAQEALRRRPIVLTTLEDPIEYALTPSTSLVRRRQVGRDVRDFPTGLRDALRQDPDLLLVGEMRDPVSIGLALTAAETGHLVLASIHSRSTASAIERIVDSYAPERQQQIRVQLADSLRVVVAQWLVPRSNGNGRVPAIEVLRVTHAVAAMIREGKTAQIPTALQSGKREGMIALERCLADLVQASEIRLEDAKAVANDPASLGMYLSSKSPAAS
jgi:twitching motility protein PilT